MDQEIARLTEQAKMGDHCSRLIKNLLTKLIIFNRRRPAECAGLKVEDYKNAAQHEDPEKIVKSLTPVEQLSAKWYSFTIYH